MSTQFSIYIMRNHLKDRQQVSKTNCAYPVRWNHAWAVKSDHNNSLYQTFRQLAYNKGEPNRSIPIHNCLRTLFAHWNEVTSLMTWKKYLTRSSCFARMAPAISGVTSDSSMTAPLNLGIGRVFLAGCRYNTHRYKIPEVDNLFYFSKTNVLTQGSWKEIRRLN